MATRIRASMAALFVGLMAMDAFAAPTLPRLDEILKVGASQPSGALKWGLSRSRVQELFAQDAAAFPVHATINDQGCVYNVSLNRASDPDSLASIRLEYAEGTPKKCRARLENLLGNLYGKPSTTRHESGWQLVTPNATLSGPMVQSAWQTETTCVNLSWKEGVGFPGSPLAVTFGDRRQVCGYDDQVVPVERRP